MSLWKGEPYDCVAQSCRPDHLPAFLASPGGSDILMAVILILAVLAVRSE